MAKNKIKAGYLNKSKELIKAMEKSLHESGQNEKAIKAAKKMPGLFDVSKDGIITPKRTK